MFRRFLAFLVLAVLLAGFGTLFYLNPGTVDFHVTSSRSYSLPLPLLLLLSFFVGGALIFLLALVRETQWSLRSRRWQRQERRRERRGTAIASGRDLLWHGRPERARSLLRRAARTDASPEASVLFAESALQDGFLDQAESIADQALARHPGHSRLLTVLADIHRRRGETGKATAVLERASAAAPDSRRLASELRDEYVRVGKWKEAVAAEERVLGLVRTPEEVLGEQRLWKGLRYEIAMEKPDEDSRIAELQALASEDSTFAPAAIALGDELRRSGKLRAAGRIWLRAARFRPLPALLARLESLYRELGRPGKVVAFYRRALSDGAKPALALRLIRFHLTNGDLEAAEGELETQREAIGDRSEYQVLRGELHRLRGQTELALQAFRRAHDPLDGSSFEYVCALCGRSSPRWSARCPACGAWDGLG